MRNGFKKAYFCGFVFFLGVLYWLYHVTVAGLILLAAYLALYFGLFGWAYVFFKPLSPGLKLLVIPASWVACEFLRGHLLSGFTLGSLGLTQYRFLPIIQVADITGMAGVSFLIALFNEVVRQKFKIGWRIFPVTVLFIIVFIYGHHQLSIPLSDRVGSFLERETLKVAVIQGNVDQNKKWETDNWDYLLQTHEVLTRQAAEMKPDLIVWPETSFPGFLWDDLPLFNTLKSFTEEINIPLLFGAVTHEKEKYFNSALLLKKDEPIEQYDKMHLVAFGEYIPLRRYLPFLVEIIPIEDFTSGQSWNLFSLKDKHFAALICFEDTAPDLVRTFTQKGAHFFVNITNDAWFGDSSEPTMHWQSSIFRAVENRRPMVRAANTGISGLINEKGEVVTRVENAQGKPTYVEGYALGELKMWSTGSFYTKHGEFFTYICFLCILVCTIIKQFRKRDLSV